MRIHIWVPDYDSATGGIQTFSRFLVRAVREIFPEASLTVIGKNDTSHPEGAGDCNTFVPIGWWPPRLRTLAFSAEICRRAARERPNLIITTHINFSPVADLLHKVFGLRFIAVGHGVDVWEIRRANVRRALSKAWKLLAVSEFTRQRMASALEMNPDHIAVLPDTFDPEKFTPGSKPRFLLRRYGLRADQPVISTIARLEATEQYKGYDQVLRALPALAQEFPELRYVLGGSGPDRARVEALMVELGLQRNVILAGTIPEHELCAHYNLCDVFAMPSKGEGFGIVFLEALACGKPVIAGNKDGSVDAVLGGKLGALVDPDDVKEIEMTLIRILRGTHPNSALRNPDELRQKVIAAYGYEKFRARLEEILGGLESAAP